MHIPEPASLQLVAGTFRARYHFILATLTSTLEEELGATEEEAQKHVVEAFAMAKGVMMQLWANHNEVRTAASAEEYLEVLVKSVWRCCFNIYMDESMIPPLPINIEATKLGASGYKSPEHIMLIEELANSDHWWTTINNRATSFVGAFTLISRDGRVNLKDLYLYLTNVAVYEDGSANFENFLAEGQPDGVWYSLEALCEQGYENAASHNLEPCDCKVYHDISCIQLRLAGAGANGKPEVEFKFP